MVDQTEPNPLENQQTKPLVLQREGSILQIPIDQVISLFKDVEDHNSRYSTVGAFFQVVKGLALKPVLEGEEGQEDDSQMIRRIISEEKFVQPGHSDIVKITNHDLLDILGLSLEQVKPKNVMFGAGEKITPNELRFVLKNNNSFIYFLRAISNEQFERSDLKQYLVFIANDLYNKIYDDYSLDRPTNDFSELFFGLETILQEYKRLGLSEVRSIKSLQTCLDHKKNNTLFEYLEIERKQLFAKPELQVFGPANWHLDSTPDSLRKRWKEALNVLKMTRNNPNAKDLYIKLLAHFRECLDKGIKDLDKLSRDDDFKSGLKRVLEETFLELSLFD